MVDTFFLKLKRFIFEQWQNVWIFHLSEFFSHFFSLLNIRKSIILMVLSIHIIVLHVYCANMFKTCGNEEIMNICMKIRILSDSDEIIIYLFCDFSHFINIF